MVAEPEENPLLQDKVIEFKGLDVEGRLQVNRNSSQGKGEIDEKFIQLVKEVSPEDVKLFQYYRQLIA
jgi:predicted small secreted protein